MIRGGWQGGFGEGLTGRRALIEWSLVGLFTAMLIGWLALTPAVDRANNLAYDALMRAQDGPADDRIIIVAIDDHSLRALGRWPWPREAHAALIDRLSEAQPRAIAYDVLFTEPEPAGDPLLATAIGRAGVVHLPLLIDAPGEDGAPWRIERPVEGLTRAAAGLGHVNIVVDADGVIRRLPLYMQAGDRVWPHLMASLAAAFSVAPPQPAPARDDDVLIGSRNANIRFHGPADGFRTVSFSDVLSGDVPRIFFKDRLVLVGAAAAGLGDRYATPAAGLHGALSPGIEVQAALLQTLLEDGGPRTVAPAWVTVISLAALILLMSGFLLLRPAANMVLGAGLMLMILAGSLIAFLGAGVWFPPAAALIGLAAAYPFWSWRRLAVASAYMQSELEAFQREGPLPVHANDAAPQGGDVVARQVDALRRATKQLRDLDRFISDTLRSLPDATVVATPEGQILASNDRARALFGETLADGGDLAALFASLGEPSWRRFVSDDSVDAGDILTPAGRVLKVAAAPLAHADGGALGHIIRFADMTAFRAVERQRHQALQLLTHDMRAPQVSILTLLDKAESGADAEDAVNRRIRNYARQTLDLAEGYVQLARAESQPYHATTTDLTQVAVDAADTLWPQAQACGVTIVTPPEDEEHLVTGDPSLLRRLIINLLDNALKYGGDAGAITCALSVETEGGAPVRVLRISDQGPGVSEEALARLFQPFAYGGEAGRRGAGLGLAFVHAVARRHGGAIRYEPGDPGAMFILTLPAAPEPPDPEMRD